MHASQLERAAYIAAHAILSANTTAPEKATPGARRTHAIDTIAQIIIETFGAHDAATEQHTTFRTERTKTATLRPKGA
jgi:hypothetical protein